MWFRRLVCYLIGHDVVFNPLGCWCHGTHWCQRCRSHVRWGGEQYEKGRFERRES